MVLQRKWADSPLLLIPMFWGWVIPEQINTQHICNAAMTNNLASVSALYVCAIEKSKPWAATEKRGWQPCEVGESACTIQLPHVFPERCDMYLSEVRLQHEGQGWSQH